MGFDVNSIFARTNCFNKDEPTCNQTFIEAYPGLSKSVTGATFAETYFLLFTRRNKYQPENLHKCAGKLPDVTKYDPTQELIVIVNPFAVGFCDVAIYREWIYQILNNSNYNVLAVDYSWGNRIDYGAAKNNIKIVANQTVIVLNNIKKRMGNITVTVIGHSLGAQLAGLIGQQFHLKKITAIDPAGPGFDMYPENERLDMGDAEFVEVWMCNMGNCFPNLGTSNLLGHVNFIINGGQVQEGCVPYSFISMAKGDFVYGIGTALLPTLCFHAHCAQYYKVAINPGNCKFVAVRCDTYDDFKSGKCKCGTDGHNCIVMGFHTEKYVQSNAVYPQTYYVTTTDTCPYCAKNCSYVGTFTDPYP